VGDKKAKNICRALGYARVSTTDQANRGVSLEAQEARIRDWCISNGYALAEITVDRGFSGGRADNRPALQDALAAVRRGDVLVVYSLSRLARSTRDTLMIAEALERRGADLVSLSEKIDTTSAAGRMVFRLLAVLAEFERDIISERTAMAMGHLRRRGDYIGGKEPFGYRLLDGGGLETVPGEQAAITRAHELHRAGLSLRKVAATLDQEGHRTRTGRPWVPEQIRRALTSRSTAG
jgi:DNA invertase Pin-like site-specific DNA recombinase